MICRPYGSYVFFAQFYPQKSAAFACINGKKLGKTEVFCVNVFFCSDLNYPLLNDIFLYVSPYKTLPDPAPQRFCPFICCR